MHESRFVLIKIFINLGGSYWVGNLIMFDSFLLRRGRDEAVTSKFATSLLVYSIKQIFLLTDPKLSI